MEEDRLKWDRKYQNNQQPGAPLTLLLQHLPLIPPGKALDLACGQGRHALPIANAGFQVDAVDISPIALARIQHDRVTTIATDLDTFVIPAASYDLIICTYFLDRRLFSAMQAGIKPGGWLLFETALSSSARIATPQFKLLPGELKQAFPQLRQHYYREYADCASLAAIRSPK